ncbi:MAG: nitroreductase [Sulfurimonadaceae bacterium]
MSSTLETLSNRSSIRKFLSKPLSKETLQTILSAAAMTPSGANMQPWIVYAVSNEAKLKEVGDAVIAAMEQGVPNDQFIQYYPLNWINPYKKRRIETGVGLYSLMGVDRKDTQTRTQMWHDNFRWFGAPTVLFVFTDKALIEGASGALIDCGAYMQSLMLAAESLGVASCPQGSTTEFGKVIAKVLEAPDNLALLYSVVLGYADPDAKINTYKPPRIPLEEHVTWVE